MNITLITSVIDTPQNPLSYSVIRSVFNKEQRFEHTKKTISSIREKITNTKIFLIECSILSKEETNYFKENTDYFYNIYESNNDLLINRMFSPSKSMGEGTMTIIALKWLLENNIEYDNLFKISGRYWLNETFNYNLYNNSSSCIHKINNNENNVFTCFYKLTKDTSYKWLKFLLNSESDFINCIGFENIFSIFIKTIKKDLYIIENKIGINGYVTVCGTFINM